MCLAVLRHKIETERAKIRMEHEHTNTLKCTSVDERTRRNKPIYKTKSSTERISVIKKTHTQTQTKNGSGQNLKLMIYAHDAGSCCVCVCFVSLHQNISFSTESSTKMLFYYYVWWFYVRGAIAGNALMSKCTRISRLSSQASERKVTCRTCEHSKLISRNRGETETNTEICLFTRSTHWFRSSCVCVCVIVQVYVHWHCVKGFGLSCLIACFTLFAVVIPCHRSTFPRISHLWIWMCWLHFPRWWNEKCKQSGQV